MADRATLGARRSVGWEEFISLPEDDLRELIDGELVEVEVPGADHEQIVATLIYHLQSWIREHGRGRVLGSGYKVRVSEDRGLMPDVQLLSDETWRMCEREGLASGRPELAIEVLSPSSRRHDRVTKLESYAQIGVPEYWIVDPEAHTVERLLLRDDRYVIAETAAGEDIFCPASFDGLEIPLAELWNGHAR